jgi:hypothetical protein
MSYAVADFLFSTGRKSQRIENRDDQSFNRVPEEMVFAGRVFIG